MRGSRERLLVALGVVLTLFWPVLLGGLVGGRSGMLFGALAYAVFGGLLALVLALGAVRGILGN
jgi:hypothetical protein